MPKPPLNPNKVGVLAMCGVCNRQKAPRGRSVSVDDKLNYCTASLTLNHCVGYRQPPFVGSLWPGESEVDYGYRVGVDGTEIKP